MAASTIGRDTWVNDSGTAANPNGDGTLLTNTVLQNHIYARIDAMFSGAAPLTLGGLLAVEGFGSHTFTAGGAGGNNVFVRNTTAGATNYAGIFYGNDGSSTAGQVAHTSSTYTASGAIPQDGMYINGSRAGGLTVGALHASGVVRFFSGGTTERARFDTAGYLGIGTSAPQRRLHIHSGTVNEATMMISSVAPILLVADNVVYSSASHGAMFAFPTAGDHYLTGTLAGDLLVATDHPLSSGYAAGEGNIIFATPSGNSTAKTERLRITGAGAVLIGDTSNANVTLGLTINQLTADDTLFAGKSSDISHGMTAIAEADTYVRICKVHPTTGGASLLGLSASSTGPGLVLHGAVATTDTVKSTASNAAVNIESAEQSGTGFAALSANGNICVMRSASLARHIFDVEGDYHYDGAAPANYDAWDDVALLRTLDRTFAGPGFIESAWDRFVSYHRADLERAGIVSAGGMVNMTKHTRLLNGAVWQLFTQLQHVTARLAALEAGR